MGVPMLHVSWGNKELLQTNIEGRLPGFSTEYKWQLKNRVLITKAHNGRILSKFVIKLNIVYTQPHPKNMPWAHQNATVDLGATSYVIKLRTANAGYSLIGERSCSTFEEAAKEVLASIDSIEIKKLPTTNIDMIDFKNGRRRRNQSASTGVGGINGARVIGFARPVGKLDLEVLDHYNPDEVNERCCLFLMIVHTMGGRVRHIVTDGEKWHSVMDKGGGVLRLSKATAPFMEVKKMNQIDKYIVNEAIKTFFE